jgi:hypothetical protein
MGHLKTLVWILALICAAVILAGCTSSSSVDNTKTPMVVSTIGAPTPEPTEPPEPTIGPTWTPTPTPVPPAMSLSNFNLTIRINGDQKAPSGDPNQTAVGNAQYATRMDTAKFTVKNTGDATREELEIVYRIVTPISVIDSAGRTTTTDQVQSKKVAIGTLKPGESRQISLESPMYGAMLEANLTITAKWSGGSLDLYKTTLEPDFRGGTTQSPPNDLAVKTWGSAYN